MANRYVSNKPGLRAFLRGEAVQNLVDSHTNRIANAAGDGFVASTRQGRVRYRGIVYPDTYSAMQRNARDNILVRRLG